MMAADFPAATVWWHRRMMRAVDDYTKTFAADDPGRAAAVRSGLMRAIDTITGTITLFAEELPGDLPAVVEMLSSSGAALAASVHASRHTSGICGDHQECLGPVMLQIEHYVMLSFEAALDDQRERANGGCQSRAH